MAKKHKITTTFAILLIMATLMPWFSPEANAESSSVDIISIDPETGHVGDMVQIVGTINTTNGGYKIYFDEKEVESGTSFGNAVNTTFAVPFSAQGSHNVTLFDVDNLTYSLPVGFNVTTSYYVKAEPARRPEGFTTDITVGVDGAIENTTYAFTVNVTDPDSQVYTTNLNVSIDAKGSGFNSTSYYEDFSSGAHTKYVGEYDVAVIGFNETLAHGSFTVGLTEELEYRVTNDVYIRGSDYEMGKFVTANITHTLTGETVFSQSSNATDGTVSYKWTIPENATLGIYSVTLTNATEGTVKKIPDIQNFTVIRVIVQVQARNKYDNSSLAGVKVEAVLEFGGVISSKITDETGWVEFRIDKANYNFRALWEDEIVGALTQAVAGNVTSEYVLLKNFSIGCELAYIKISVVDEADPPQPLSFIDVILKSDKTGTLIFLTNNTGTITLNTFTNIRYTIEAWRYGHLFKETLIENLTATSLINITCPTYTLFVHVLDSKGLPIQNVQVGAYEWGSERVMETRATDTSGSVSLSYTFGKYRVSVYNYSAELQREVVLNETVVDLIEDEKFLVIYSKIYNLDLSVKVVDYFGQAIPNAVVEIEREFKQVYESIANLTTKSDGTASFPRIGGNYRVTVSLSGKLYDVRTLYLDETKVIVFKIDRLVLIGGIPLQTNQLMAGISLGILVAILVLALVYRKLRQKKVDEN